MIENADALGGTAVREAALACVEAGIEAAHPRRVVREGVGIEGDTLRVGDATYDLGAYDRIVVLGGGKASGTVAAELEGILGDRVAEGVVVAPDPVETERIEVVVGDHPVPSERGVEGARRVLDLAAAADEGTLVLAVVTGGGSALLPAPEGIELADLRRVTGALLDSGAAVDEINAVRKHLSAIKGGGLARAAAPAAVVGLLLSDVVGNDPGVIASGPTAPDATTYGVALDVLDCYGIDAPPAVRERLERGMAGDPPETPRAGDPAFGRVHNHVLADGFTAVAAAREAAAERGYATLILSSRVRGEAREAAKIHVAIAEECLATGNPVGPPAAVLSGGETTVTVRGDGEGGPNQEFALSAALSIDDAALASVDTDGRDGATDAAGALVDADTVDRSGDARAALRNNDAYTYLAERDALVYTGATGTNVNDLRVLIVDPG